MQTNLTAAVLIDALIEQGEDKEEMAFWKEALPLMPERFQKQLISILEEEYEKLSSLSSERIDNPSKS